MTTSESDHDPTTPEPGPEQADPGTPRELTPEEREELRKKIEQASKEDPNIYPVF